MNYKAVVTRVNSAHGRHTVEVQIGDNWYPVAVREDYNVASAIETDLGLILRKYQDDEARSNDDEEE